MNLQVYDGELCNTSQQLLAIEYCCKAFRLRYLRGFIFNTCIFATLSRS